MDLSEVRKILIDTGLSEWETEAYLILVRYGPQTAVDLSRLSKIARSKTYEVTTRLRRKGLVMKVPPMPTKGVTQKFVAINPQDVFPRKIEELNEASKFLLQAYNSPLKARYPKINFYTTKDNVRKLLLRLPKGSKSIHLFLTDSSIRRILGLSFDLWIKDISKNKGTFLLGKNFHYLSKNLKEATLSNDLNGVNYIITPKSLLIDLWESQHIVLEIQSKEAAKTFRSQFFSKLNG